MASQWGPIAGVGLGIISPLYIALSSQQAVQDMDDLIPRIEPSSKGALKPVCRASFVHVSVPTPELHPRGAKILGGEDVRSRLPRLGSINIKKRTKVELGTIHIWERVQEIME